MNPLMLSGETLTLNDVVDVATAGRPVALAPQSLTRMSAARALVERMADADAPTYGINTGFGTLAEVRIDKKDLRALQKNLIVSHAAGVGAPLSVPEARALLLLRCNVLAKGFSGVRVETLQLGLELLNRGVTPVVPERGSVGASGDLAPLAHLALVFIGLGEAFVAGERMAGAHALKQVGLSPIELQAKEGLTLVNGTQAMCAVGGLTQALVDRLAETFDLAGAMTVEGLMGSHTPFISQVHAVRPHPGHGEVAAHLRRLLSGSSIAPSHADCGKVQDPYSLRCMPQVHGAAREALRFSRGLLACEINAGTDNPLVFAEEGRVVSAGNFHGQPVALALDVLAMGTTQLMGISERRIEQLVNPSLSGLPPFLSKHSGLNSGFMIAQVTAAALVAEARAWCHPASVDSIPTSANREDHVSMGMGAALKARSVADHAAHVVAIELLCAAQALDFRAPLQAGQGVQAAYQLLRQHVAPMDVDREVHIDIKTVVGLVRNGALVNAAHLASA